jgi:acetyl esterase/lipase
VARHLWPVLDAQGRRYQRRLALAGDSGGGTFAATLSALAQNDQRLPVEKQVLIYPSLDYTLNHPSVTENGQGYLLEAERIAWYFEHYFQHGEDRRGASPLFMPVSNRLPETLVISAEYCPLRDEALAYVQRLNDTGVPCRHCHFDDMIHAYLNLESLAPDACAATYREIAAFLNGSS